MTGLAVTLAGVVVTLSVVGTVSAGEQQLVDDLHHLCSSWAAHTGQRVPDGCQ